MTATAATPEEVQAGSDLPLPFWQRFSDRVNPILVRELQQSLRSRSLTSALFCALIVLFALAGVIGVMSLDDRELTETGRGAFMACFGCLMPFLTLLLPLQAFFSMMHEVRDGTAELLLLSKLTPREIVRGKLQAAGVLFVLFLALFAPSMALTWLLRGVSVAMIVMACIFALLSALTCSSLAIAAGSLARARQVTPLLIALIALGLAGITIAAIASGVRLIETIERYPGREILVVLGSIGLSLISALWLFALVARSQLTHPVENRATPFRILFAALVPILCGWIMIAVERPDWPEAFATFGVAFNLFFVVPALIISTEEDGLSPRVRNLVPKRLALPSAPWLPGGKLGIVYVVCLEIVVVGLSLGIPALLGFGASRGTVAWRTCWLLGSALYLLIYTAIGSCYRSLLGPGVAKSWLARTMTVTTFALLMILPLLVQALFSRRVDGWSFLHIMNPFWTIDWFDGKPGDQAKLYLALGAIAFGLLVLQLPGIRRAVREVLAASRARATATS